jgi:hypothetical protein
MKNQSCYLLRRLLLPLGCCLLILSGSRAQDKSLAKFQKITPADFDLSKAGFDSGANAVLIADVGGTSFEGNNKGDFTLVFTRHLRAKIINKNGFDIATRTIILFSNANDEERLISLKASTYNLENEAVTETKLDEKSIFTSKIDKETQTRKFTMPALKEGSVFDISYTIKSDFYTHLRSWSFQGDYPCLWSEYEVTIPEFFNYVSLLRGDDRFEVNTATTSYADFTLRESGGTETDDVFHIRGNTLKHHWVKKNVPAIKEETYMSASSNYLSRVSFQLHYVQFGENGIRHNFLRDWFMASEKLLEEERFGVALDMDNHWMSEPLKPLLEGSRTGEETTRRLFNYIRDHFTCTDHDNLYTSQSLKDVFRKKTGNVADLNLLLVALLRHEGVPADPVILSTRDNGYADQNYPLISEYNYVLCQASPEGKLVNLDASWPANGFGHLPPDCYNGQGRVINKTKPYLVDLYADSLRERKITTVFITNDDKGYPTGAYKGVLGTNESFDLRKQMKETTEKDYFKKIQTGFGSELEMEDHGIDSLNSLENPVQVHFDFNLKNLTGNDLIYFNPMLKEALINNPFKADTRIYPVEMPYTIHETYILNMEIPKGYAVEELPKSARMSYNDDDGFFEYLAAKSDEVVQLKVTLKLNKAFIPAADYPILRDFFAGIVKKESEQIVFKKK